MSKATRQRSAASLDPPRSRDIQPLETGVDGYVPSPQLLRDYESEASYKGRTIIARALWRSTPPPVKIAATRNRGKHGGNWLREVLSPIDIRAGRAALQPTVWMALLLILSREADSVWELLDQRKIVPAHVGFIVRRSKKFMNAGLPWDQALTRALAQLDRRTRHQQPAEVTPTPRQEVQKPPQYRQIKTILEDAPPARDLPVPDGYDPLTFRSAYAEYLENIRVAQWLARHAFHTARRHAAIASISIKVAAVYRACRILRIERPAVGMPVDEFNARRKWLEVVKTCHPDKNGGDAAKVRIYDEANKAFETIKNYNRDLTSKPKDNDVHNDPQP